MASDVWADEGRPPRSNWYRAPGLASLGFPVKRQSDKPLPGVDMPAELFLRQAYVRPDAKFSDADFPGTLPFIRNFDIRFVAPVTIFVGENGSGKSTVMEALAELCGLPVGGGGRNELGALSMSRQRSELAPFLRASFLKKPRDGYFFRAEFQAHFAALLEERRADPEFQGNPYARYGGLPLHTQSHGEAFLAVLSSWMRPGLILMDEPEAALSPQRQLSLLLQIARLAGSGSTQFVIATHSTIMMTYPGASLLSFDGASITPTRLEDTSHFQITKGVLEHPQRYWKHLLIDEEQSGERD